MEAFLLNDKVYLRKLIESLTAFMFGFLGAYIYFIGDLIRSYFTLDLTAHTFVANSIRMVTSSILALVLSFIFQELPGAKLVMSSDAGFFNWLPVLSFGICFFPVEVYSC
jgi:hypothetical protein